MKKIEQFHYHSDRIRGSIINWTINLERSMDSYISKHFFTDKKKRLELMELIISDRVSFFEKTQILKELLTRQCIAQKKVFSHEYPKYADDFKEIGEDRNRFAHNMTVPTPSKSDMDKYVIILFKFKNKAQPIKYTLEDIEVITKRIVKYVKLLDRLHGNPL